MPFMDRKKIFVTTKLGINKEDTEQTIMDRFGKCQERLNTPYVDSLFISGASHADLIKHKGYHAAIKRLKADGRIKHAGVACHGPRGMQGDSLEKVLLAAVEDGRFDLMLMLYNFLNNAEGNKVLAACKEKNIGTMAMKTAPGRISEIPDFDPENPSKEYAENIKMYTSFGMPREQAIQLLKNDIMTQKKAREDTKPFLAKYGLKTEEQLWEGSIKWVRKNSDMHSVCVSMNDFDKVDKAVALSGKNLTANQQAFLSDYENVLGWSYCRHGCTQCLEVCKRSLPVSTIMRYSYYYEQGHEKLAMEKYSALKDHNAYVCAGCSAPCTGACPYGVMIQSNMLKAHTMLTLA
jgi:predicted aldo/keto reductase-like oxidoreductase